MKAYYSPLNRPVLIVCNTAAVMGSLAEAVHQYTAEDAFPAALGLSPTDFDLLVRDPEVITRVVGRTWLIDPQKLFFDCLGDAAKVAEFAPLLDVLLARDRSARWHPILVSIDTLNAAVRKYRYPTSLQTLVIGATLSLRLTTDHDNQRWVHDVPLVSP